ncbi:hypothetical protein A3D80_00065 [Candidatus Roizmanbacteria bacterium RIFCSPHIGHO2_02_FULL_40_13b]|uniref:VanZ-like domain-containing protein n=1 Tax=Candidatus Roizmanbacteria bacterium RIFCSPHIGHO2_01_FULL_39_24 TaxID=1802032 RepID=A0A1F7GJ78_9BACT|nr:MAG: hypothetical protein A2799_03835 [Candidatus Roizmanbacteria bacterium RIFCSPHIGHO2_01_FULL_39_24]OGK27781.1 MAG: hypothetical protein A3D80_00065 [Candidatus Roizmanbacteria bacterium RIFCSPHIGHO2_02_FULL_40_13b]OGK56402.1 MAG: hypothetical protein A3H83_01135 [Candidatus Roizmanbacteria bacterium RIFCSPLOWO2_02_FULL_39_8]
MIRNFLNYWLPIIFWMGAIFFFSSRQHFVIVNITTLDFIIFKILHMVEYAFLFYLWFRALNQTTKLPIQKQLLYAVIISVAYATTDELHQYFVPTREGKLRDVIIDFTGIVVVWYYIRNNINFVTKYLV